MHKGSQCITGSVTSEVKGVFRPDMCLYCGCSLAQWAVGLLTGLCSPSALLVVYPDSGSDSWRLGAIVSSADR